jgi:hypothetical protein
MPLTLMPDDGLNYLQMVEWQMENDPVATARGSDTFPIGSR